MERAAEEVSFSVDEFQIAATLGDKDQIARTFPSPGCMPVGARYVPPARGTKVAKRVIAWVFAHSKSRRSARSVLLAIADVADDSGGSAKVTRARLAAKTLYNESTVRRAVRKLEELGELESRRLGNGHLEYRVIMNPPPSRPSPAVERPIPTQRSGPIPSARSAQGVTRQQEGTGFSTVRFHVPPGTRRSLDVTDANDGREGSDRI